MWMLKTFVATCRATIGGWFWLIAWNKANELPKVPMYFTLSREWKLKRNHAVAWFPFSSPHKLLELVVPQGIHSATQSMRPAMSSSDKSDLFEASSRTIYSQKASRQGARMVRQLARPHPQVLQLPRSPPQEQDPLRAKSEKMSQKLCDLPKCWGQVKIDFAQTMQI